MILDSEDSKKYIDFIMMFFLLCLDPKVLIEGELTLNIICVDYLFFNWKCYYFGKYLLKKYNFSIFPKSVFLRKRKSYIKRKVFVNIEEADYGYFLMKIISI